MTWRRVIWMAGMAGMAWAGPAMAGGGASLRLAGQVNSDCRIQVMDSSTDLDISTGVANYPLATIGERCNDDGGYKVVLISANNGFLRTLSGRGLSYSVSYGPLQNTVLTTPRTLVNDTPQLDWRQRLLKVTIPVDRGLLADAYSDSLTLSIEAR